MKRKTFTKISAIILIFAILLSCVNIKVFAEVNSSSTGTITVTGIESGVTVKAYQLTTVNWENSVSQPKDPSYEWVGEVQAWIDQNYPQYSDPEDFYAAFYNEESETVEWASVFYSELSAAISNGTINLEATKTERTEGSASYPVEDSKLTESVTFTECSMGTYLVLIENGYMVYSPSVVNLTPTYNQDSGAWELAESVAVEVKATKPQITKTASEKEVDNYSTNSSLSFTISADVPTYLEGAIAKTYIISDTLSGGLVLDKSSVKVYGGTDEVLTEGTHYTLETTDTGLKITFDYEEIKDYSSITVTYTATLTASEKTVLGSTGNTNNATLTYSNNPYVESSSIEQSDVVTIYTYGIEVTKVDKKDTEKTLSGAVFQLTDGEKTLYFVRTSEGKYYLADSSVSGATTDLAVNSNGKLCIYGLDEGTYYLTEIKAPGGYNISNETYELVISDKDLDGLVDNDAAGYVKSDGNGIIEILFPNTLGFQLPLTGGIGTVIFIAGGLVLIVVGIGFLVVYNKKNKNKK